LRLLVHGPGHDADGNRALSDDHFQLGAGFVEAGLDPTHAYVLVQGWAVGAAGDLAHGLAVPGDRVVGARHAAVYDLEVDHALALRVGGRALEGSPADEVNSLVELDEPPEARPNGVAVAGR